MSEEKQLNQTVYLLEDPGVLRGKIIHVLHSGPDYEFITPQALA